LETESGTVVIFKYSVAAICEARVRSALTAGEVSASSPSRGVRRRLYGHRSSLLSDQRQVEVG
jgi:hypothetical protein